MILATLLLLVPVLAIGQPLVAGLLGLHGWILDLVPLLLIYGALRLPAVQLVFLMIAGGMLHDLMVPHAPGTGPLLWGVILFMIRSQLDWIRQGNWIILILLGFVSTFLYLSLERVLFLAAHGYWSWDLDLSLKIVNASFLNALLAPLFTALLDRLTGMAGKAGARGAFLLHADR
jgi:hypothetical protein